MKREVDRLYVTDVIVATNRRNTDPDRVAQLAASMKALGLQTPISVWSGDNETVHLVVGRHRLEAAKLLGWEQIDGIFVEMTERQRRLWEISENLHRADLSALERAELEAEWMRLSAEEAEVSRQVDAKLPIGRPAGGRREAARSIGMNEPAARRAEAVAKLEPEAKEEARSLHLDDNQSALLKASRHATKEDQIRALREHAVKRVTFSEANSSEKRIEKFQTAAKALSPEEFAIADEWFTEFRVERGAAVFDRGAMSARA